MVLKLPSVTHRVVAMTPGLDGEVPAWLGVSDSQSSSRGSESGWSSPSLGRTVLLEHCLSY